MPLGPQPYEVVYDTTNGLQYVFESGPVAVDASGNISSAEVTSKLLTGYVSGAGTVGATDTILQGINKLNGNAALKMPLAGGAFTGAVTFTGTTFAFTPPKLTTTQRDALTATKGMMIYNTSTDALNYYDGAWQAVAKV